MLGAFGGPPRDLKKNGGRVLTKQSSSYKAVIPLYRILYMALYGTSEPQIGLRWYKHTYAYLSTRLCTRTSFKTFATVKRLNKIQ